MRRWVFLAIVAFAFVLSAAFYSRVPDTIPTHWGVDGTVDGYSHKAIGLFVPPVVLLVLLGLYVLLPKIAVYKENLQKSSRQYEGVFLSIFLFLFFLQITSLASAVGHTIDMKFVTIIGVSVLLFYIGGLIKDVKRNFFLGIRTPWTLASDKVWKKTHKAGSIVFKVLALMFLLALFCEWAFKAVIVATILSVVALFVYSYVLFAREKK